MFQGPTDVLISAASQSCSEPSCPQQITQLQVYRSLQLPYLLRLFQGQRYYRLLDQISVQGPEEADLTRLSHHPKLVSGSNRPLPLTRIERYEPAPKPGVWLRLTGLRTEGSATAAYGQILYFDPTEARLSLMVTWLSPTGVLPAWQQVTGEGLPELVVDESIGLEPAFSVYQLQPAANDAQQIRRISVAKPAFSHPLYARGLALAQGGLWSPALRLLQQVKQQSSRWSPQAQAQLDYIQLHAWQTQAQAQQTTANPVQKISAYLINGSWNPALTVFQDQNTNRAEVKSMLQADLGGSVYPSASGLSSSTRTKGCDRLGHVTPAYPTKSRNSIGLGTATSPEATLKTVAYVQKLITQLDAPRQSARHPFHLHKNQTQPPPCH